jgi:hypothetical protein
MRFDLTNLNQEVQRQFLESVKNCLVEDDNYRVFYDSWKKEFVLLKADYVIRNTCADCLD